MKSLLKHNSTNQGLVAHCLQCDNQSIIGRIRNNEFAPAFLYSYRKSICSSPGNDSVENRRDVDPYVFVFHKWGISWNPVGLFFAFMVACYCNIFTQERSLGIFWGVEVYLLSIILPSQFFRAFLGLTKISVIDWYLNQGFKIEQRVRKSPALGAGILLVIIGLCLTIYMGDSIIREDASLVFRIFRGITYPYVALVLLFRGTQALNDPWLMKEIADTIKTLLKYPQDKPGKSTAIAALGGGFALFAYFERKAEMLEKKTEMLRQEQLERDKEACKLWQEDERRDLLTAEDLVKEIGSHPDPDIRMQAADVMAKVIDHRRDHNILPLVSDLLPEGLESLSRRAQKASEIRTNALEVWRSMINKSLDTTKVVDYGKSVNSPFEDHFNWGDWALSCIM